MGLERNWQIRTAEVRVLCHDQGVRRVGIERNYFRKTSGLPSVVMYVAYPRESVGVALPVVPIVEPRSSWPAPFY